MKKPTKEIQNKILLAFEFASVISLVARERDIEYNAEIVENAQEIIKTELFEHSAEEFAKNMVPLALSVFTKNKTTE